MKPPLLALGLACALAMPALARAEERTVTLEVAGLYCPSCPYIAAQAIRSVPSARIVGGFYDPKAELARFEVIYDDAQASLDRLIAVTTDYGYPSRLLEGEAGDAAGGGS